jgi:hypothetical protein
VLRVDGKNLREHSIMNCCGVIITTNHKNNGIFLTADDRRHYVAWSELTTAAFGQDYGREYFTKLYKWFERDGVAHVAAYLNELDLSDFDAKAPPEKTPAFWAIVDTGGAWEDGKFADAIDAMERPDALTLREIAREAEVELRDWVNDSRNFRIIPHRLEAAGYINVRNNDAKDGCWVVGGKRQKIYARKELTEAQRQEAARKKLTPKEGSNVLRPNFRRSRPFSPRD